jgi:hypothetical protein
MKHNTKRLPEVGVHPKRVLSPSEQKNLATTAAASAIINEETSKWESKTARLRALRLAKEAADEAERAAQPPKTAKPRTKTARTAKAE